MGHPTEVKELLNGREDEKMDPNNKPARTLTDNKPARTLTEKELSTLRRAVKKAFAHTYSLCILAKENVIDELGSEEVYTILSEASWELEQARSLLEGSAE